MADVQFAQLKTELKLLELRLTIKFGLMVMAAVVAVVALVKLI